MTLRKKLLLAVFAVASGIGSAYATSAACIACDAAFWRCGGYQNDHCTMRYEICMRSNNCPLP